MRQLVVPGVLAVVWAVVLIPQYLRNRAESRPADSIGTFAKQLAVLERACPPAWSGTADGADGHAGHLGGDSAVLRRRRPGAPTHPSGPRSGRRSPSRRTPCCNADAGAPSRASSSRWRQR